MSYFDRFRDLLSAAVRTATTYVNSADGQKMINKVITTGTQLFSDTVTDVLEGKTPKLVDTAKRVLMLTDPASKSAVTTDLRLYQNEMSDTRFQRNYSDALVALQGEVDSAIIADNAVVRHEKEQDMWIAHQNEFDLDLQASIDAMGKEISEMSDDEKVRTMAIQKAINAIKNHMRFEDTSQKALATASSLKAGVDTFGTFIQAIPVLGSIIKGTVDAIATTATVAETAIAFTGPDFTGLDSAVVSLNDSIRKQMIQKKTKLDAPVLQADAKAIFEDAMKVAKVDVFRINRPHLNANNLSERETFVSSIQTAGAARVGLHVFTPAISDMSVMIMHYIPTEREHNHVFLIFDVEVADIFRVVVPRVSTNGEIKSGELVRHEVWEDYARARDVTLESEIKYTQSGRKDSSLIAGTNGLGLAHIAYLGNGHSESDVLARAERLIQNRFLLMKNRTSQEFRSLIAAVMMGQKRIVN